MTYYIRVLILLGILALLLFASGAHAQTSPVASGYVYGNGVLSSVAYTTEAQTVPAGKQFQFKRTEQYMWFMPSPEAPSMSIVDAIILDAFAADANGWAYGRTTLVQNHGPGLGVGDYVRVQGGSGINIAHKTAVSCGPGNWACWAYSVNLGAGATAAFYITGDNPTLYGRARDDVANIMLIESNVNPTNAVIQWNAVPDATGVLLRIVKAGRVTFEVTSDGVARARRFEVLP